jgi:hypothetical protein
MVAVPALRELLAEHQRIGRKACENTILMTQDSSGDTLKNTSLRKYPSTILMGPCSREDVIGLLGGGALAAGWRPDRLVAAEGDDPNDAGKFFVRSGRFRTPTPYRLPWLDSLTEIHTRAHERIKAGLPSLDGDPDGHGEELAVIIPPTLAAVRAAFAAAGDPEKLPSADVAAAVGMVDANALALALRPHLGPRPTRWYLDDGQKVRGYWLDDVRAAIEGL